MSFRALSLIFLSPCLRPMGFPTSSSCFGNMSLNGTVFASAPVSMFKVKLCIPGMLHRCIFRVAYASFLLKIDVSTTMNDNSFACDVLSS